MFREDLESREEEIIRTLSSLPRGFVLIGGYAISALSAHRFSVDCDILVSRKDLREFRNQLRRERYSKKKSTTGFDKIYGGSVEIYTKKIKSGGVSVDLFVDSVTARKTGATWSYEYIKNNSNQTTISTIRGSASVLVPSKELLMAMKIHSGRDTDMRDIVMLSEDIDWKSAAKHTARGEKEIVLSILTDIISKMADQRFGSSLRAAFELRSRVEPLVSACRARLSELRTLIESVDD
ncbi:MAG: nucleotidyl transferase AbiEii/AbiGii toxin family protein [Nitrososphaerales archaeon]